MHTIMFAWWSHMNGSTLRKLVSLLNSVIAGAGSFIGTFAYRLQNKTIASGVLHYFEKTIIIISCLQNTSSKVLVDDRFYNHIGIDDNELHEVIGDVIGTFLNISIGFIQIECDANQGASLSVNPSESRL